MGITIKDVARKARVSVATVSRALNGHDRVGEQARARVLAAADELRYSPDHAARSLINRRTDTLGVVLPDLHGEFFSELIRGIDQAARTHNKQLLLSSYHGNRDEQIQALRTMRGRVDGLLILSPGMPQDDELQSSHTFAQMGMPSVFINMPKVDHPLVSVSVDNYRGARIMTRHLLDAGHRSIAFLAGPIDNFDAHERLRGYRDEMTQAGNQAWILSHGDFSEAYGYRIGHELASASARPDAVFAANDMMALGCLFALHQAELRVPEDIALAGFDDIPLSKYVYPALTTMRVDIAELGARAVEALLSPASVHLSASLPQLIVRKTSQPIS